MNDSTPAGVPFAQIWSQGDGVSHAVALILLLMSLASWSVILVKGWNLLRLRRLSARAGQFWHRTSLAEGIAALGPDAHNPFRHLTERSTEAVAHHTRHRDELHGVLELNDWLSSTMRQTLDDATRRMQAGLSLLASVGSTAPFVGLFGTVWGITHALTGIGLSGQARLDQVAGPVGESLVMTAGGLAVAIPAVLAYNALTRGNREIVARLRHFAHDLHAYLVTGGKLRTLSVPPADLPRQEAA